MSDIDMNELYKILCEHEQKLSDMIDNSYNKLNQNLEDNFQLLHNDIKLLNDEIKSL